MCSRCQSKATPPPKTKRPLAKCSGDRLFSVRRGSVPIGPVRMDTPHPDALAAVYPVQAMSGTAKQPGKCAHCSAQHAQF